MKLRPNPRLILAAAILALLLLAPQVLGQGWGPPPGPAPGPPGSFLHLAEVERMVFHLTNEVRRQHGLAPLEADPALDLTAWAHSDDMLRRGFFSHTNPDGLAPRDRLAPGTSGILQCGENIWAGSGLNYADSWGLARMIVEHWLSSPGHRENLLSPAYTHLGVGVCTLGPETRATQVFVPRPREPRR
jgi:uncharacterized protein YkwD